MGYSFVQPYVTERRLTIKAISARRNEPFSRRRGRLLALLTSPIQTTGRILPRRPPASTATYLFLSSFSSFKGQACFYRVFMTANNTTSIAIPKKPALFHHTAWVARRA